MRLARVPLHQQPGRFIQVEPGATVGARLGVNLVGEDGAVLDAAALAALLQVEAGAAEPVAYWRYLQNIPANVQQVAALADTGYVRRLAGGQWIAKEPGFVQVTQASDFPAAVAGVRTLAADTTYLICADIDLAGDRLVASAGSAVLGLSPESCSLSSTGLVGTALLTSAHATPLRFLTFTADIALDIDNGGGSSSWYSLRFVNCGAVGTVANLDRLVLSNCSTTNSGALTLDGSLGGVQFQNCLLRPADSTTAIVVPATASFTRQLGLLYCAFETDDASQGCLDVSASAGINAESYGLDNCRFSGPGTYIAGLDETANETVFFNCIGIPNSAWIAHYYMQANATATAIAVSGTFVKVAGTTTAGTYIGHFTHSDNRATASGASTAQYLVQALLSLTSGNNQDLRVRVAKNGTTIAASTASIRTSGTGEAANITVMDIVELAPNDYIEIWLTNDTSTASVTVVDLNVIVTRL